MRIDLNLRKDEILHCPFPVLVCVQLASEGLDEILLAAPVELSHGLVIGIISFGGSACCSCQILSSLESIEVWIHLHMCVREKSNQLASPRNVRLNASVSSMCSSLFQSECAVDHV